MNSFKELLVNIANANGGNFNGHSDIESCARYLKKLNNTGYSTIDLPNFFVKAGNRIRDEYWEIEAPFATKMLPAVSKKDFRTEKSIRPMGGNVWEKVDAKGKIAHFQYTDEMNYETRLGTIAQLLVWTRQMAINDDLGVIKDLLTMMVEGSTMYPDMQLLDLIFTNPGAGFRVNSQNYFTGSGAALTRANLSTIHNTIKKINIPKQHGNWVNLDSSGWYLVVGPDLEETAWELVGQPIIMPSGGPTASTARTGTKNYFYGKFEPVTWAQLGNTDAYATASGTDWMLLPKNPRYNPYTISYLGNQRKPVIEAVDLPSEFLGAGTRGYFDIHVQERHNVAFALCRPSI